MIKHKNNKLKKYFRVSIQQNKKKELISKNFKQIDLKN